MILFPWRTLMQCPKPDGRSIILHLTAPDSGQLLFLMMKVRDLGRFFENIFTLSEVTCKESKHHLEFKCSTDVNQSILDMNYTK